MATYRLEGWIVEHDHKFSGGVSRVVDLDHEPTLEEAERLMWDAADDEVVKVRPDVSREHLRIDFVSVRVTLEGS